MTWSTGVDQKLKSNCSCFSVDFATLETSYELRTLVIRFLNKFKILKFWNFCSLVLGKIQNFLKPKLFYWFRLFKFESRESINWMKMDSIDGLSITWSTNVWLVVQLMIFDSDFITRNFTLNLMYLSSRIYLWIEHAQLPGVLDLKRALERLNLNFNICTCKL